MKKLLTTFTVLFLLFVFPIFNPPTKAQCSPGNNCCTCDADQDLGNNTCATIVDDDYCNNGNVASCNSETISCSLTPSCSCLDVGTVSCGDQDQKCCTGGACTGSLDCFQIGFGNTQCLFACTTNDDCAEGRVCGNSGGCVDNPFTNNNYSLAVFCSPGGQQQEEFSDRFWTAIGCIPTNDNQALAEFFLSRGLAFLGVLALILMGYGGILVITAQGDSAKMESGMKTIKAAASAILFVFLTLLLLRIIGATYLNLPGFST